MAPSQVEDRSYLTRLYRFALCLTKKVLWLLFVLAFIAAVLSAIFALCLVAYFIGDSIWAWITPFVWWKIVLAIGLFFAALFGWVVLLIASQIRHDG